MGSWVPAELGGVWGSVALLAPFSLPCAEEELGLIMLRVMMGSHSLPHTLGWLTAALSSR